MSDVQTELDYADAIADWFLELGENCILSSELEAALKYTHVAATILCRQNRNLSSSRLEAILRSIAGRISEPSRNDGGLPIELAKSQSCLHVLDEALPAGGLTAMATRWIRNDSSGRVHHIALLWQKSPIPVDLQSASRDTGGRIFTADPNASYLDRARWLRSLSNYLGGFVVLHIGVTDVVCGVAFGVSGGAPVLLVNHAAHIFWTGVSIADVVVNCRGSDLERIWTETHRAGRCAVVPIPLLEPLRNTTDGKRRVEEKSLAKGKIGVPPDSIVILTVGASFKYLPVNDLDFVQVFESILTQLPGAFLFAVGVQPDSRWGDASARVGARIKVLGSISQSQLAQIRAATDVYVEGFPFGSTTALLEAGLDGIPLVLAPEQCPPPFGSDGIALDGVLERPRSIEQYEETVIQLSTNPSLAAIHGDKVREAIRQKHTGLGWREHLEGAIRVLPSAHLTYPFNTPTRTPDFAHEYWAAFVAKHTYGYEETLEHAVTRALLLGLRPRLTKTVRRACRNYRSVRIHRTIPLPLLVVLCNNLLQVLPAAWSSSVFRSISFLFRGLFLDRLRKWIVRLFGGIERSRSWYGEYRYVRDR